MEIQQLRGFVAVAEHKNFTRAAAATFRSQPAISLQIKALEEEMGVQLIRREPGREIELTIEGEALYRLAIRLLEEVDSMKLKIAPSRKDQGAGSLRVITDLTSMPVPLYDHVRRFKAAEPDCSVSLACRNTQAFLDDLASGRADVGISSQGSFPANFVHETVYSFHRFLITPKDHPLASKPKLELADIADYPLIVTNNVGTDRELVETVLSGVGKPLDISLELDHPENVKYYVGHGVGIAILNELFIRPEDLRNLWFRDVSNWFGCGEVALVHHEKRILSQAARRWCAMLLAERDAVRAERQSAEGIIVPAAA